MYFYPVQTQKFFRILITSLAVLIVLAIAFRVGFYFWVNTRLTKLLNEQPDQLHHLSYDHLRVRLLEGSVWLQGLSYEPNEQLVKEALKQDQHPELTVELKVEKAELLGLSYIKLLKNIVHVDSILIEKPTLAIYILPKPKVTRSTKSTAYQQLSNGIQLGGLKIVEAEAAIYSTDLKDTLAYGSMQQLDYEMRGVNYQDSIKNDLGQLVADIQLQAKGVSIPDAGGYHVELDELGLDFYRNNITFAKGSMTPNQTLKEFEEKHPYRKPRFKVSFDTVHLMNVDYGRVLYHEWFAEELAVEGLNANLYINNQKPFPPDKEFHFLPTLIRSIPKPIALHLVKMTDCTFKYEMPGKEGEKQAELWFNNIDGTLTGLTNLTEKDSVLQPLELDITCSPQGKGNVHTIWKMNLQDSDDGFDIYVNATELDLPSFNSMVQRTTHIAINSGELPSMVFTMRGNDAKARGDIRYGLEKVDLTVNRVSDKKGIHTDKFVSFLANKVVAKTNQEVRYYKSHYQLERPEQTSFFKFFWLGLQEGLKEGFLHNQEYKKKRKRKGKNKA